MKDCKINPNHNYQMKILNRLYYQRSRSERQQSGRCKNNAGNAL